MNAATEQDLFTFMQQNRVAYRLGKLSRQQIAAFEQLPGWDWTPQLSFALGDEEYSFIAVIEEAAARFRGRITQDGFTDDDMELRWGYAVEICALLRAKDWAAVAHKAALAFSYLDTIILGVKDIDAEFGDKLCHAAEVIEFMCYDIQKELGYEVDESDEGE